MIDIVRWRRSGIEDTRSGGSVARACHSRFRQSHRKGCDGPAHRSRLAMQLHDFSPIVKLYVRQFYGSVEFQRKNEPILADNLSMRIRLTDDHPTNNAARNDVTRIFKTPCLFAARGRRCGRWFFPVIVPVDLQFCGTVENCIAVELSEIVPSPLHEGFDLGAGRS